MNRYDWLLIKIMTGLLILNFIAIMTVFMINDVLLVVGLSKNSLESI